MKILLDTYLGGHIYQINEPASGWQVHYKGKKYGDRVNGQNADIIKMGKKCIDNIENYDRGI